MMPRPSRLTAAAGHIGALRAELADLALELERRGRRDAADVAGAVAARLGEIEDEVRAPAGSSHPLAPVRRAS